MRPTGNERRGRDSGGKRGQGGRRATAPPAALLAALCLAACLDGAGGCQHSGGSGSASPATPKHRVVTESVIRRPSAQTTADATDPCAEQLQDDCGLILQWFLTHNQLPATLDDLAALQGSNVEDLFVCPVTRQPYNYNPQGLQASDHPYRMVLYDAAPHPGGKRVVVLVRFPQPNQPPQAFVRLLSEPQFRAYVPAE